VVCRGSESQAVLVRAVVDACAHSGRVTAFNSVRRSENFWAFRNGG